MPILIMDRHWDVVLNGFPDASNHGTHATLKLYFRSAFMDKNRWNKLTAPSSTQDSPPPQRTTWPQMSTVSRWRGQYEEGILNHPHRGRVLAFTLGI